MLNVLARLFKKPRTYLVMSFNAIIMWLFMMMTAQFGILRGLTNYFDWNDERLYTGVFSTLSKTFLSMGISEQVLLVLFAFSFGLNLVIFIEYFKVYRNLLRGVGTHLTLVGVVVAALGTGCLSCGALLLAPLASLLGISFASWFVQHGLLVSIIGLLLVTGSTIFLLRKLVQPKVCSVVLA